MLPRETDYKASPGGSLTCVSCPSYPQSPHLPLAYTRCSFLMLTEAFFTAGPETALSLLSKVSGPKIFMFLGL